jgi:hypothetical protein
LSETQQFEGQIASVHPFNPTYRISFQKVSGSWILGPLFASPIDLQALGQYEPTNHNPKSIIRIPKSTYAA